MDKPPDECNIRAITYTHTYRSIGYHPVKMRVVDAKRRVTRYEGDPVVISINRPPDGGTGMRSGARASTYTVGGDFLLASCVDSPAMSQADPPVTALDLHPREAGAACAALLFELLAGGAGAERAPER